MATRSGVWGKQSTSNAMVVWGGGGPEPPHQRMTSTSMP